ncbi:MAG: hypothetical protein EXX96DRAFT_332850 [Benjaminiella poitrasii]|nr:MAG: hypothetical protein EXX96DRAFT_332850 [Benjaminiella poitrasii]
MEFFKKQLCLSLNQGGLGILDPEKQHMVLQFKYLSALFRKHHPPKDIVLPLILSSLALDHPVSANFLLSCFFIPEYRKALPINHPTNTIDIMFKAFDHFRFKFDFTNLYIDYLLQLPLQYMFRKIPPTHWLYKHNQIPASSLLTYNKQDQ